MWFRWMSAVGVLSIMALAGGGLAVDKAKAKEDKGKAKGPPSIETLFKLMDTNSDGKVSKEEFVKHHEEWYARAKEKDKTKDKLKGTAEDRRKTLERRFKRFDKDGDGFLTLEEFRKGLEEIREKRDKLKDKIEEFKKNRQKKDQ